MNDVKKQSYQYTYKIVPFIIFTFAITWICAYLMTKMDNTSYGFVLIILDFVENASPLIVALLLIKRQLNKKGFFMGFVFGERKGFGPYIIVALLFILQFLNFYLFCTDEVTLTFQMFASVFAGQLLLGGGLEEAGWRGYLLPAFEQRMPVLLASVAVSLIWVVWHIPYFILPGSMHSGGNFISYTIIGIITGFVLTAIYKLTKSVLLCTLFHSWQNTIVMTLQADMQNPGFMMCFLTLGIIAVVITIFLERKSKSGQRKDGQL